MNAWYTGLSISVAIATSLSSVAYAGPGVWTSGGPYGGSVQALAINPTTPATLYAGTSGGGVFKSTDSGGTWAAANTGLTNLDVRALAINPTTPATLYAGTLGGGVFKSTDSGGTWAAANTGLTNLDVRALAINPTTPATLYAGTSGGGVFKSTDSGGTWAAAHTGLTNLDVRALAINTTTPSTLYAGAPGFGVFKSTDSGGTWAAANTGLTYLYVLALAINPTTPATLYAGTDGGVFKSTDSGGTWAAANTGLTDLYVDALAINPTTPSTLYAGAYGSGVFKSTDSGGTWAAANTGLTYLYVNALAINPTTPATLYAGTDGGGVFKSADSGGTWAAANTGLTDLYVDALAINPTTPATLYAGAYGSGVFKSTDSGGTWAAANTGLTYLYVNALAINPTTPTTLYAGTSGGVFKSTDSGGTWAAANTGLTILGVNALAIDPTGSATLYAGTWKGVFKSTDSGGTWAAANTGLTYLNVNALAINPTTPATLYAGTNGGSVWQFTPATGTTTTTALLPSSARAPGAGGAFYTTDLTVANTGTTPTTFAVKFLGNNADGRVGPEKSFPIGAGASTTFSDVLGSVFGLTADYGAIRIASPSDSVRAIAQTSTRGFGGTFGQSVPAARPEDLITGGTPRSILAVREDDSFRTNLILTNATEAALDVDVQLISTDGFVLATKRYPLAPLGMTQVTKVVRDMGIAANLSGARLVISTPTTSGAFAAYASAVDNVTNDPRTLLPVGPIVSARPSPDYWILPSSARASGAGGAFYTTDVTVAYTNAVSARYTLKFLGNNMDGRGGPETTFDLGPQKSVTYTDVLGSVFQRTSDYGAIRVASQYPSSDSNFIGVLAQTSTPGFGGTFGQSVPAVTAADLIRTGTARSILAVEEDDSFRTNLILTNATEAALDVDVQLISTDGIVLATKRYSLAPLGMTQVTKVVRDMGIAANLSGARLVISTPTTSGAFAAYASAVDNVTNDPRTLLPR
jgi:photosystem II stability/assembly factor-like uncharacterized protein